MNAPAVIGMLLANDGLGEFVPIIVILLLMGIAQVFNKKAKKQQEEQRQETERRRREHREAMAKQQAEKAQRDARAKPKRPQPAGAAPDKPRGGGLRRTAGKPPAPSRTQRSAMPASASVRPKMPDMPDNVTHSACTDPAELVAPGQSRAPAQSTASVANTESAVSTSSVGSVASVASGGERSPIAVYLSAAQRARQAMIFHEIFSPPKALRTGGSEPWER